jgi:tetratricopeptide (TPR) repeat protein
MAKNVNLVQEPVLSASKQRVFTLIALSIPVILFVLLELGLRIGGYGGDLKLFTKFQGYGGGELYTPNPNFAARYFVNVRLIPTPSRDSFLADKPENGLRLFVLGESTTAGYPYGFNGMFSRVLRDALVDVLPNDSVEVVNIATSAVNSYTVYDQIDEILAHEPDGVLIYLGHNEFYGALGVASSESLGAFPGFVRFYLKLQRLRTFLLLRDAVGSVAGLFSGKPDDGTLMQRVVREQQIPLDSDLYQMGRRQFESNLDAILSKLQTAGIPVYIASVTSNTVDQPPFESVDSEVYPPANVVYSEAQQLLSQGDTSAARRSFKLARDLDALRFRATDDFNYVIKEAASRHNAVYVPIGEAFEANSLGGLVGLNLMLEHLHPNDTGYHLMGRVFYESIAQNGFFGRDAQPDRLSEWDEYKQKMYLSEFEHQSVWHRLQVLMQAWPFVKNQTTDYRNTYIPKNMVDSTAFAFVNGRVNWEKSKVELGNWYERNGLFDEAMLEYRGLMRDQPQNDSPMLFVARILLDRGEYAQALPLLETAYRISPSAYGMKMLGALEVDRNNLDRGIELLEKSLAQRSDDPQTAFNLSGAWAMKGNYSKALEYANKTEAINPRFPGLQGLKQQLLSLQ